MVERALKRVCLSLIVLLLAGGHTDAATRLEQRTPRGSAITQTFLGGDGSLVRTPSGMVCVASRRIDIAASTYREPSGEPAPFDAIQRSAAANVAFLAIPRAQPPIAASDASLPALRMRIEFKFALRPDGLTLDVPGDGAVHLVPFVEPSGDSVLIDDPVLALRLKRLLAADRAVFVTAQSLDTGRTIRDRLPAPEFMTFEACLASASALPDRIATAAAVAPSITVTPLRSIPGGAPAAMADRAPVCDAPRPGLRYEAARIDGIRGFTAPSALAFIGYDDRARPVHVRAPGVFDAAGAQGEAWPSAISIAADTNDPATPNAVKGCLGAAVARLCVTPAPGGGGALELGACIGDLAGDFDLLSAEILGAAPVDGGAFPGLAGLLAAPVAALSQGDAAGGRPGGGSATGPGGFGGGGQGASAASTPGRSPGPGGAAANDDGGAGDDDGGSTTPVDIPAVPLPPAATLLLAALALLALLRRRRTVA